MKIDVDKSLIDLAKSASAPVYIVGGYVRNALAGFGETDVDICGPIIPTAIGLDNTYKVKVVNYRLGTAVIKKGSAEYEYTPFRVENYADGGGHSPIEIFFTTDIYKDALRRDFTCNSVYYDIVKDEIIDLVGGVEDINRKVVRAYNPEKTFSSDGLRILRLVRIAAETGFKLDGATAQSAMNNVHLLADISAERKREELNRILVADTKYGVVNAHYRAIKLMSQMGIWKYLIPEIAECAGVEQNPKYHKYDVLEHTFQTVKFASPNVRLAALMHDLGKPYCMQMYGNTHGHEKSSEAIVRSALGESGLKYSNDIKDEVARLCLYHMYDMANNTSEPKLRVFIAKNWDIIDKLVDLIKADRQGSGMPLDISGGRFLQIRNNMLAENTPIKLADLNIDGNDLVDSGIKSSSIGAILNELLETCIITPRLNTHEWLMKSILKHIKK